MEQKSGLKTILVTGRTIEQGVGKEIGKNSQEYYDSVSICFVDPEDLERMGIKDKENITVSTDFGSVVLKAVESLRGPHPGLIFIPYGPWANVVVDPDTSGIGMPSLKGIPAYVEPAPDKPVLELGELIKKRFGKW
ncbi:MAG: molybdopterin dinucleotide binding domain-containing protein [Thermoproteota archaeon]